MVDLTWLRAQVWVALGLSVSACGAGSSGATTPADASLTADNGAADSQPDLTADDSSDTASVELADGSDDPPPADAIDVTEPDTLADVIDVTEPDTLVDAADADGWCSVPGEVSGSGSGWGLLAPFKQCLGADAIVANNGGPTIGSCPIGLPPDATAIAPDPPYTGPLPPEGCPPVRWGWSSYGYEYQLAFSAIESGECCYYFCPTGSICGRPLTIDDQQRIASLTEAPAWTDAGGQKPSPAAPYAAALASAWRADALDEHASIASFQRFGLELLAVGAPPELVRDSLTAAADEVRHAEQSFAIAQRLDGEAIGPGPLDLKGLQLGGSLAEVLVAAIAEGCVGETLAAAHAAAAARRTADPQVAQTLLLIAADEARHAALAWRFATWACSVGGAEVRAAAARAFAAALRTAPAPRRSDLLLEGVPDADQYAWGRLPVASAQALYRAVLADVVAPAAAVLTGGDAVPAT